MGALAPIANLLSLANAGGVSSQSSGAQQAANKSSSKAAATTPPIDNFFGIDSNFLKSPAGGTALFNNLLYGTSNQQVPVDFLKMGYYTGLPPIFGGSGFTGLPSNFDMFSGSGTSTTAAKDTTSKTDDKKADSGNISLDTLKQMTLGDLIKLLS